MTGEPETDLRALIMGHLGRMVNCKHCKSLKAPPPSGKNEKKKEKISNGWVWVGEKKKIVIVGSIFTLKSDHYEMTAFYRCWTISCGGT